MDTAANAETDQFFLVMVGTGHGPLSRSQGE